MTKKFDFALVDAFSAKPFSGNPCAIVLGADKLSASQMLKIAQEMNQSETAFLMKSKTADLKARYFTPAEEIPLAGHPTIASIHIALERGLIAPSKKTVSLELRDGPIQVHLKKQKNKLLIQMVQRKPHFGEIHDARRVASLFNLTQNDLLKSYPVQTVSTGTPQLMVPLKSHAALRKLIMNVPAYQTYRKQHGFFSPHFFCLGGATSRGDTFARHLGVPPDTLEDPFTGSATGGMGAYLWKYGLIAKPKFIAEQGHRMGRPGSALVEINGPAKDIQSVSVSGTAVTVIVGRLTI